jgi:hypothetical protein
MADEKRLLANAKPPAVPQIIVFSGKKIVSFAQKFFCARHVAFYRRINILYSNLKHN